MRLNIHAICHPAAHRSTSRQRDHAARHHRHRDRAHRRIRRTHLVVIVPLAVVGLLVSASSASAETTHVLALAASLDQVLTNIRTWIMGILAGLATVFMSLGGVRYVMAGGDPSEVEKAKTAFRAASIGYGMAALAPLIVTVLRGIVGA
jgi:Type IV secretion system pilin